MKKALFVYRQKCFFQLYSPAASYIALQLYSAYALTIMFDDCGKLIEWYFDIAKSVGTENGIPFEDDLYLDLAIMPDGERIILDEDELLAARNEGLISQEDMDGAYNTLRELEQKYASCLDDLIQLTEYLKKRFCM